MYVIPVIERYMGKKTVSQTEEAISGSLVNKPSGITWFLKGFYEAGIARALDAQESYRLSSFARANCLIQLGEDQTFCNPGDPIKIHFLPL
jgi:molybdopterin molybdotransferase